MMTVREYTEEFHQANLREGHVEYTLEKKARYINGLRLDIQDEISILSPRIIEEAYQCALKAEEKIARKQNSSRGVVLLEGEENKLENRSFSTKE